MLHIVFMVGGNELCTAVGDVPHIGAEISIANDIISPVGQRYVVHVIRYTYESSSAHTDVEAQVFSGGPFRVIQKLAHVFLEPVRST